MRTTKLDAIVEFYCTKLGMQVWLEQPGVTILQSDNLLLGFHQQDVADTDSLITFFFEDKTTVDTTYEQLQDIAITSPKVNEIYNIYNFFAKDPEGRKIEIQKFLHDLPQY